MITDSQLQRIMPNLPFAKRSIYLPLLNRVMTIFRINNPLRAAAFLAQIAHESGELRFLEEIWGPTAAQRRYEPPSDLATRLGNTEPGDGERYKGRGAIQLTGRANYRKYGDLLGVDLESNPPLAASPQIAISTAGAYWQINGLNQLADVGDFETITRRINGGLNGYNDRLRYYERAGSVLGVDRGGTFSAEEEWDDI
jgi:putative chitinase